MCQIIKCGLSGLISVAEMYVVSLFHCSLWREKVGDYVDYLHSILQCWGRLLD